MAARSVISLLVGLGLMAGLPAAAMASARVTFNGSVSASTCDLQVKGRPSVWLGQFTQADFISNWVRLSGRESLSLIFPDKRCGGGVGPMKLKVTGPSALGARGENWGDVHRNLAYGIRLNYEQDGVAGRYVLTPKRNTISIYVPSGRMQKSGGVMHHVVIRPELRTWDHSRVRSGTMLSIPLIFSVVYE